MNKVGLYLRVSTEEQARIAEGSLVSQRKRLEEYVEGQNRREPGWGAVIDIYCDEAKSGKDMNRPEFQRMLSDIRSGRINLVLATELSRLSRSIKDFCGLWELFKDHDAKFVTLREQFDTTTAAGEMMVFNLINFAQFERKQTAERISANWASRARRGLWNGGSIPLGYDRNPVNKGVLVINEAEAEQVRTIFKTFLETGSLRQTCLKLPSLGIKSKEFTNKAGIRKGGQNLTMSGLYHLLSNRALIGEREIWKKRGTPEIKPASWPAIVDVKTFNLVQERLKTNRSRYKPEEWKTYAYPLTEKIVCGECGKVMGGKSAYGRNGKHHYYEHGRKPKSDGIHHLRRCRLERLRAERIEGMVLGALKTTLSDPARLDDAIRAYSKAKTAEIPGRDGRIAALTSDIRTNEKRVETLVSRLSDLPADVPADPIYTRLRDLNTKLAEQRGALAKLEADRAQGQAQAIDPEGLKRRLEQALAKLETVSADKQRPIYDSVLKFAEFYPNRMRLGLYAPAPSGAFAAEPLRGGSCSVFNGAGDWT